MNFELLNVFSGFQIGAKLNGRGDATTKLEMICLQVRKLNFFNEMQLGDFPVSHTTDDIAFFGFWKKLWSSMSGAGLARLFTTG